MTRPPVRVGRARFDSEAYIYQYLFDEDLYRDRGRWTIRTDRGDAVDAQFFVSCAGMLSAPMKNVFAGQASFRGEIHHTSRWPVGGVELAGRRVGVVGIGATGIQVIQTIADEVAHLTVFARTPQYVLPMKSPAYGPEEQAAYKARFDELKATIPHTFTGFEYDFVHVWAECSPEQRRAVLEEIYEDGSLKLWLASFGEMFFLQDVSDEISEFVREKMRARLEATKEGEDAWVAHHEETSGATLIANTTGWYLGSNVPGKPRRVLSYTGGVGTYRQKCDDVARHGYPGFAVR